MIKEVRKDFYVYEWFNIDTDEVFYVGKGTKYRLNTLQGRNQYFLNYHKKHKCSVRKIKDNMSEEDSLALEVSTILKYRNIGQCKCNLSEGGEGATFKEGSWDKAYQKVRSLYNLPSARVDEMPYGDFFYYKDLKEMSIDRLHEMYDLYKINKRDLEWQDSISNTFEGESARDEWERKAWDASVSSEYLKDRDGEALVHFNQMKIKELKEKSINGHLDIQMRARNVFERKEYKFKDFNFIEDDLVTSEERDVYVEKMFSQLGFAIDFINAIWAMLWLLKSHSVDELLSCRSDIVIKTFSIIDDRTLRIRLKSSPKSKTQTILIDVYGLVWDMATDPFSMGYETLYSHILDEIK